MSHGNKKSWTSEKSLNFVSFPVKQKATGNKQYDPQYVPWKLKTFENFREQFHTHTLFPFHLFYPNPIIGIEKCCLNIY